MTTIKDIAKIANVSHTTVSRALNDSSLIKKETRERIKEIAKGLDYVPNPNARALVSSKSNNIGLFFSSLTVGTSGSFLQEVILNVSMKMGHGYNIIINAIDSYENYNEINNKNYVGVLLVSQTKNDDFFISSMVKKGIPIVVINRDVHGLDVMNIVSDDKAGTYEGISYCIEKGYRKIGFIEGIPGFESSKLRKEGYLEALASANLNYQEQYVVQGDYSVDGGYYAMKKLLSLAKHPQAVFCSNDETAFGAAKAIQEAGLKIPEDIGIMGFDDSLFAQYMSPPLTTIKRPVSQISSEGIQLLIDLIDDSTGEPQKIYRPSYVVQRQSI